MLFARSTKYMQTAIINWTKTKPVFITTERYSVFQAIASKCAGRLCGISGSLVRGIYVCCRDAKRKKNPNSLSTLQEPYCLWTSCNQPWQYVKLDHRLYYIAVHNLVFGGRSKTQRVYYIMFSIPSGRGWLWLSTTSYHF